MEDKVAQNSFSRRGRALIRRGWLPAAFVFIYLYNFPYFTAIHSANELPRIYLTMAMVDRGALNIDPELRRHQFTPDTSTYKGKIYANKAPGMSLINVPVYAMMKLANGGKEPQLPRMFFWFRMAASMLPSLLFLILLWRFLGELIRDPGMRRMVLAAYGLGTMAFTYGTLLIAHQLSALLMFTSYILIFLRSRGRGGRFSLGWAGLAAGAGVLVDYQVAFIGPPLFLYALLKGRKIWPRLRDGILFGLGSIIPLALLLLYQWKCFDDPLKTGYHYPSAKLFQTFHSQGFLGMKEFNFDSFWGSFFTDDNGLFYFSMFLLMSLPGLVMMLLKKGLRADFILCSSMIALFAYFVSALTFWRAGWAVGPRYITCSLPFYLVPVAVFLGGVERLRWYWRTLPFALMALSILFYVTTNAVFPHFPENFSNPWFDVTLRFGRAGYVAYNLGWLLGLKGLVSAIPYLLVLIALITALLLGGQGRWWQRGVVAVGALAIMSSIIFCHYQGLWHRSHPLPVKFMPWMERMWEPRHGGMDLKKLLPRGNPEQSGLQTQASWW